MRSCERSWGLKIIHLEKSSGDCVFFVILYCMILLSLLLICQILLHVLLIIPLFLYFLVISLCSVPFQHMQKCKLLFKEIFDYRLEIKRALAYLICIKRECTSKNTLLPCDHMDCISGWSSCLCMCPAWCPSPCLPAWPFNISNLDHTDSQAADGSHRWGLKWPLGPIANIRGRLKSLLGLNLQIGSTAYHVSTARAERRQL